MSSAGSQLYPATGKRITSTIVHKVRSHPMNLYGPRLWQTTPPWLWRWVADVDDTYSGICQARLAVLGKDYFVGALRGTEMRARDDVFEQFATLLQFPRHFGGNWNAFIDCINDLDWLCARGIAIIILDAVHVCDEADADELSLLLRLLADAGRRWAEPNELRESLPFHVVLHAAPSDSPALHRRMLRAGHDAPTLSLAQI